MYEKNYIYIYIIIYIYIERERDYSSLCYRKHPSQERIKLEGLLTIFTSHDTPTDFVTHLVRSPPATRGLLAQVRC